MVGEQLIMPALVELGERWHRGELSITREHFATNYLLQRVSAILRASPGAPFGPVVWAACAPGEFHEIGLLLLGVYLRRIGCQVRHLGQDLPEADLLSELQQYQPDMILFSASGMESALRLRTLCAQIAEQEPPRPIIGYGGRIFNLRADLRDQMAGVYLGSTAAEAVEMVGELLAQRPHHDLTERSSA
jgi:methanogenic corrinoid protein MtbC1